MKCAECNLCWAAEGERFPSCKADPNWPAPCEYDDDAIVDESYDPGLEPDWELDSSEKNWSCAECTHSGQETTDDVACCNCCEDGSFFEEYKDEYTLADLGNNWW